MTDERLDVLSLGLSAALRDCAALSPDEGDALLCVGTPLEDGDSRGEREGSGLLLGRGLPEELREARAELDSDTLDEGMKDAESVPDMNDDDSVGEPDIEPVAAAVVDGTAVSDGVAVCVERSVPAEETDCVREFTPLADVVAVADAISVARDDADAVLLGIEAEGCDVAETEDDATPLRESALLVDAHADAGLEVVGSGVADISADIEVAAVAPGDAETRGDSLAFAEFERAGENVPVETLLVDGLADLEIVGDASVEAENVPE